MALTLAALVLPLGVDTFAVAAALGIAGLTGSERLRVTFLFTVFEAGMPLAGLLLGAALGQVAGGYAELLAMAVLVGVGLWMLLSRDGDEDRARLIARTHGLAAVGLGVSISTDELAIGFTLGLVRVSIALAIVLIAVEAFVATQLGLRLGARLGSRLSEAAARVAGGALILVAIALGMARYLSGVSTAGL